MKKNKNIAPSFMELTKLGVFAGLCVGLTTPAIADTASNTSKQTSKSSESQKSDDTLIIKATLPSLYVPKTLSDPKFTRPLADTTRTVTVVPEKVIQEQHATTLTDAMKNVAGAGAFFAGENGSSTTGDAIYMRGVDTSNSIYVDGIRDIAAVSRDTFNISNVEVLKGPSGSDYGRSAPSGSINMITKKPELSTNVDGSLSYGSASNRRATVDYNQMINDNAAFRINMMGDNGHDKTRDKVSHEKYGFAPSIAFGLETDTRLFLDYVHVHQNNTPDGGIPTIGLPGYSAPNGYSDSGVPEANRYSALNTSGKVSRHKFYGTNSDYDKSSADSITLKFEHDFSEETTLRNTTRWSQTRQQYLMTALMGGADSYNKNTGVVSRNINMHGSENVDDWTWSRLANTRDSVNKILTNQTNLTTKFSTGSIKHDVSTGVEFTHESQTIRGLNAISPPAVNIYHPDSSISVGGLSRNGADAHGTTDTFGLYAFDTLQLTEKFEINGGARLDSYQTDYKSATACGGSGRGAVACSAGVAKGTPVRTVDTSKSGNLFNWKAGALYHLTEQGNVYANYGVSQQPPGGNNFQLTASSTTSKNANSTDFQPQKAATAEVGTKWNLMDSRLLLTAALFRTDIKNEVEQDASTKDYSQVGRKRVEGYELTISGDITDNWHALAGYTLQNAKVSEGKAVNNDGSKYLSYTPRHAFTAWTTYQITPDWVAGAGARYVGSMHRGTDGAVGTPNTIDNYWVADAMTGYQVNRNLDLQLNVYNLFDKHYVQSINKSGYRYHPGAERSWMLTANVHF